MATILELYGSYLALPNITCKQCGYVHTLARLLDSPYGDCYCSHCLQADWLAPADAARYYVAVAFDYLERGNIDSAACYLIDAGRTLQVLDVYGPRQSESS